MALPETQPEVSRKIGNERGWAIGTWKDIGTGPWVDMSLLRIAGPFKKEMIKFDTKSAYSLLMLFVVYRRTQEKPDAELLSQERVDRNTMVACP